MILEQSAGLTQSRTAVGTGVRLDCGGVVTGVTEARLRRAFLCLDFLVLLDQAKSTYQKEYK